MAAASLSRISRIKGASLGAWAATVASTFTMVQPASTLGCRTDALRGHLPQQRRAVRPGVARIAVRKQLADVPQRRRTQQSIHHRVGQHVRVGVPQQPLLKGHRHTAQHQGAARYQPVYVIAVSNAQIRHALFSLSRRNASAMVRSSRVVILMFSRQPGASHTSLPSRSTAEQSSVMSAPA